MSRIENLLGKKFGKLTIIARDVNSKSGKAMWKCKCDCGKIKEKSVTGYDLKSGKVQSCGCNYFISNSHINETHNGVGTRLYRIWQGAKQRCYYKNAACFSRYGGRGIIVCKEWRDDFATFREWALNNGYSDDLTLDRIDVNGNYEPMNCRWITMRKQQNNRSNNHTLTINGETHTLSEWGKIKGINSATISYRISKGWNDSEIFILPNYNNKNLRKNQHE